MNKHPNIPASYMMGAYNILILSVISFAMVYLLAQGLDEAQVGLLVALSNVVATLGQPFLANLTDKKAQVTNWTIILALSLVTGLGLLASLVFSHQPLVLFLAYMLAMASVNILMPFHNAIIMAIQSLGRRVDYGLVRAMGSFTYAVGTLIMGYMITFLGSNTIIYVGFFGLGVYTLANAFLYRHHRPSPSQQTKVRLVTSESHQGSPAGFFKRYPQFAYVLAGALFLFIGHNALGTFLLQIIMRLGGDAANLGWAFALAAIVEVPPMIYYQKYARVIGHRKLLLASGVFFLVKSILTLLAQSLAFLYLAQSFQALAFAIYIIASVYYTDAMMAEEDKTRGQAYLTSFQSMGGIIGGAAGGWLISQFSLTFLLGAIVGVSALGAVIFFIGLSKEAPQEAG